MGYGMNKWTCGECGESFEASGVVGDLKVERWRRDHKEEHRVEKLSDEERNDHYRRRAESALRVSRERYG
jgi:hypothetical protein